MSILKGILLGYLIGSLIATSYLFLGVTVSLIVASITGITLGVLTE